jgi:hypothetical protein
MPRIDDLSDAEFMKLQAEYGDSLPICPICTLEDVRHLLLELVTGDAVSDEVKGALASVLYGVTGSLGTFGPNGRHDLCRCSAQRRFGGRTVCGWLGVTVRGRVSQTVLHAHSHRSTTGLRQDGLATMRGL